MALTEEQLELLGERLVPLFQELERAVINDVARRLTATGKLTETAEIMAETLRDKGFSPSAIYTQVMRVVGADELLQREIAINTRQLKAEIVEEVAGLRERVEGEKDMWTEAGNMAFHNDLSVWKGAAKPVQGSAFEKLVEAAKKRATDEVLNLTKSLGFHTSTGMNVRAERIYRHELNLALTKVCSGAYSFDQAVEEAIREMAASGLRVVDFESGVTRQIDTAARNAVRTAASQLAGEITMQNARDTDCNHVEVSAHWGSREGEGHANHAGWQGRIYCIEGTDGVYENLEQATGYPSDPKGLKGYNCRHDFYPFWPGLSEPNTWPPEPEPVTVNGRRYTYYQATQEQRRREREIRALKREESALKASGLDDRAKQVRGRIRTKTAEYREFSDAVGIRAKENRLRVCEGLKIGAGSGTIKVRGDTVAAIRSPIEQRNTGKGNPGAVLHLGRPLNNRQQRLLDGLPEYDSRITVRKRDVSMRDLASLTAETGVEYAMFTRKNERLVIRGSEYMTNITQEAAQQMAKEGWRWSGHTHPGSDDLCLLPSDGDKVILEAFGQDASMIINSRGQWTIFEREE